MKCCPAGGAYRKTNLCRNQKYSMGPIPQLYPHKWFLPMQTVDGNAEDRQSCKEIKENMANSTIFEVAWFLGTCTFANGCEDSLKIFTLRLLYGLHELAPPPQTFMDTLEIPWVTLGGNYHQDKMRIKLIPLFPKGQCSRKLLLLRSWLCGLAAALWRVQISGSVLFTGPTRDCTGAGWELFNPKCFWERKNHLPNLAKSTVQCCYLQSNSEWQNLCVGYFQELPRISLFHTHASQPGWWAGYTKMDKAAYICTGTKIQEQKALRKLPLLLMGRMQGRVLACPQSHQIKYHIFYHFVKILVS